VLFINKNIIYILLLFLFYHFINIDYPFVPCLRVQPFQEINEGEYSINLRKKIIWGGSLHKFLPMVYRLTIYYIYIYNR